MTSTDESDSLISALNKARIPLGNHAFIRQIVSGVGIDSYPANVDTSKPHVIATRSDGGKGSGHLLRLHRGISLRGRDRPNPRTRSLARARQIPARYVVGGSPDKRDLRRQ